MSTIYCDSMVRELNKLFEGSDFVAGHSTLIATIYVKHKPSNVTFLKYLGNAKVGKHRAADENDALDHIESLVRAIVQKDRINAGHRHADFVLGLNEILISKCETRV